MMKHRHAAVYVPMRWRSKMKTIIVALALVLLAACPTFATAATQDASALSVSPSSREDTAVYFPMQSISYQFGSKSMSGYLLQHAQDLPGYADDHREE
jgi:hypothetical protein